VRALSPVLLRVPELDAANPATLTGEVDHSRPVARGDSVSNLEFVVFAALKVDNNSLKFNVAASNPELKLPEGPAIVYVNRVVIPSPVDIRLPELLPSALVA